MVPLLLTFWKIQNNRGQWLPEARDQRVTDYRRHRESFETMEISYISAEMVIYMII
jgi:hypothetical protein